jgi:hypothetical protein
MPQHLWVTSAVDGALDIIEEFIASDQGRAKSGNRPCYAW